MKASIPPNEASRLAALRDYDILDTPPEPKLDDITALAAEICETPISTITFVDESRQWFKSKVGLESEGDPRDHSFCAHALAGPELLVVENALQDARFADNPLVLKEDGIRFYAGAPLVTPSGEVLGTLCVIDRVERKLTPKQERALRVLSQSVMTVMELRRQIRQEKRMTALLHEAQQIAKMGSWELDLMTHVSTWSVETSVLFGIELKDFSGTRKAFLEFVLPEDRHLFAGTEAGSSDADWETEYRIRRRDNGEIRWISERGKLVTDEHGKAIRRLGMVMDITERKCVEEVLRESEKRHRWLFEHNPHPMWIYDVDTLRFLEVNHMAVAMYGYSREKFLQLTILDIRPPEDVPAIYKRLADLGSAPGHSGLWRHLRKDGTTIQVDITSQPLEFQGATARLVLGLDVTARVSALNALQRSEERFRRTFQNAATGMVIATLEGQFLETNAAYRQMVGYSEAELHGLNVFSITVPEDRKRDQGLIDDVRDGRRENCVYEKRYLRKDGRVVWSQISLSLIRDPMGQQSSFIAVTEDLTARKHAEEERDRFFNYSMDMLCVANFDGWLELVNPAWTHTLGWTAEELTNRPLLEFVHPEDWDVTGAMQEQIRLGKPCRDFENRYLCKDGTHRWLSWNVYPMPETRQVFAVARDITHGRESEEQRKRDGQRLSEQAALLDSAREAIHVKDLSGRIIYWNKGAERTYGWTSEEVLGKNSVGLLYKDPREFDLVLDAIISTGEWHGEAVKRTKDGKDLTIDVRCTVVNDSAGQPKSILGIDTDITEKKKLEAQFLRAQRMESIGTLAGGIAHDLNNMLAPIMMSLEILKTRFPDKDTETLLQTLLTSAQRGSDLVKQVLSFARGVEGQRVVVDPIYILRDIQKIAQDTFPKSITFELNIGRDLWTITGDHTQLHQVFLNLCVNARDAMPRGGHLSIDMQNVRLDETYASMNPDARPGDYVRIKVTDTGEGILPEVRDKIFEPFFTTKVMGQGTGLGLSTSIGIIKSHRGFITLISEVGKGTQFEVYLPSTTSVAAVSAIAPLPEPLPYGHDECILVVDDEQVIRETVQKTLEHFGYRTLLAANGVEALAIYAQNQKKIDLVLTDMAMPLMDGPATILALKAIHPEVRVIGSSGLSSNAHVAKEIGMAVPYFVPKPYTAETLLKTIRHALTGQHPDESQ